MQVFLFIGYFFLCCLLIYRLNLGRNTGLSTRTWLIVFSLKILASGINLYLYNNIFPRSDVAFFHWQSMGELKLLWTQPGEFFREWLLNWGDISGRMNLFNRENTPYWNNLGSLFHGKFMTLCNILSVGHIYVNILFYNLAFFTGQILLYRTFYKAQPHKKWLFLFAVFLIPSVLFWCSGVHKDGWILTAIGFIGFYTLRLQETFTWKSLLLLICAMMMLFIVRYFYFFCLFPAYVLWILSQQKKQPFAYFMVGYATLLGLFFSLGNFFPNIDPMKIIVHKQMEFLSRKGLSDMYLPELTASLQSFISNLPHAVYHILLSPFYDPKLPLRYNLAALDSLFVFLIIVLCCIYIKRRNAHRAYLYFALFFSASVYLFIGYTIPNSGALVRYKSEFTALLIPALLSFSEIPWLQRFHRN